MNFFSVALSIPIARTAFNVTLMAIFMSIGGNAPSLNLLGRLFL